VTSFAGIGQGRWHPYRLLEVRYVFSVSLIVNFRKTLNLVGRPVIHHPDQYKD
jgi:hypothetical protein